MLIMLKHCSDTELFFDFAERHCILVNEMRYNPLEWERSDL